MADSGKLFTFAAETMKVIQYYRYLGLLAALLCLLSGCSDDDSTPFDVAASDEIRFNADVWRVMEGTRATTFDNTAALQTEGCFTCYAYNHGSTTDKYIDGASTSWNSSHWSIEGRPSWPGTDYLDFFAYMPVNMTNTHCTFDSKPYDSESNPDGYSVDLPRIVCTALPVNITVGEDVTKELIYAYVPNQNKENAGSGVVLTFKRPFARIYFKLASGLSGVTINSVTIAGIKNNGSCTFDGTTTTWTQSGEATNLVVTGSPATSDTPYLVLPQTFAANLTFTVNATWSSWSNVTKNLSTTVNVGTWAPGTSYTYTFNLKGEALIVDATKYTEQW